MFPSSCNPLQSLAYAHALTVRRAGPALFQHTLLPVPPTHSQLLRCPVLCPLRNKPSNTKLMIWAPRPKETRALQGHDNGYSATFLAPAGPHFLCSPPGWGQLRARQQKLPLQKQMPDQVFYAGKLHSLFFTSTCKSKRTLFRISRASRKWSYIRWCLRVQQEKQ